MSAIATTILTFTRPGDVIVHSQPLYGGTETLISRTLSAYGVGAVGFADGVDEASLRAAVATAEGKGRISVIMIETPSNPLNTMVDIRLVARIAGEIASQAGPSPDHRVRQHAAWARIPATARLSARTYRSTR